MASRILTNRGAAWLILDPMKTSLLLTFSLLAAPVVSAGEPLGITKESAAKFYREYQRLTKEPRYVSPLTATLCRAPGPELLDKEKAITGPHFKTWIHLYVSAAAAESIAAKRAEFPEGAVIVKEKLGKDWKDVAAIGGMVKRSKGYDAKNGDWEYFYYTPGGEFTSGKLANCIGCHSGGKRDYVFSVWELGGK